MVVLALRCEYQDDLGACDELNSFEPPEEKSFVPIFLMNLFRAKEEQMLWRDGPSVCVPEECWDENDKPECRQYDKFKETEEDWDEYGNFIGTRNKCGKKGSTPTMKESSPECFDGDVFLEEKCGEITTVENDEGLINYIIGKEVENVIDEFENKSEQNKVDANGTEGRTRVNEIKQEMNQIKEQIAERTFAPGTSGIGEGKQDVKDIVVEEGENSGDDGLQPEVETSIGEGDDGLKPEVKTEVAGGGSGGDDGLQPEVKTDVASGDSGENHIDEGTDTIE